MFTTLLSQETRTLAPKLALIAGIGVLIIAVSLGLAALKIPLVSGFLLMASCLMIAMVPLLVLLQVATSYWKSMHCDAGYFTHTLPVTGGQLFWAKSIFAYIVGLVGVFWAIAASSAVFVQIAWMNGVSFNEFLSSTLDSWNALPLAIKTLLTVAILVQLANLVFPVAAVMSIGAQSRWNHLGFGAPVIGFILLYLANQFTAVFGMLLLPGGIDTTTGEFSWKFMLPELIEALKDGTNPTFIGMGSIVTTSLLSIAVVCWGIHSLKRHLSLR